MKFFLIKYIFKIEIIINSIKNNDDERENENINNKFNDDNDDNVDDDFKQFVDDFFQKFKQRRVKKFKPIVNKIEKNAKFQLKIKTTKIMK